MDRVHEYKDLMCPICHELLKDPMETGCCHNGMCYTCCLNCKKHNDNCPLCRNSPFRYNKSDKLKRFIDHIKDKENMTCMYDCGKKFKIVNAREHETTCRKAPKKCLCGYEDFKDNLASHILQEHKYSVIKNFDSLMFRRSAALERKIKSHMDITKDPRNDSTPTLLCHLGRVGKYTCKTGIEEIEDRYNDGECYCGNCTKLDRKLRSLPRNYVVNGDGAIAKFDTFLRSFYCNRTLDEAGLKCTPSKSCSGCRRCNKSSIFLDT